MQSPKGRICGKGAARGVGPGRDPHANAIELDNGLLVTPAGRGGFPLIVCLIRGGKDNLKNFRFFLRKLGLACQLAQAFEELREGGPSTPEGWYEVWGAPDALEQFRGLPFVAESHLPVACRVPCQATGTGPEKQRPSKPPMRTEAKFGTFREANAEDAEPVLRAPNRFGGVSGAR